MKARTAAIALALCAQVGLACGGPGAKSPAQADAHLPQLFTTAFRVDATGDPAAAVRAHLDVVRAAAQADGDPFQVPALEASLDALTTRSLSSLGDAASDAALERRTREPIAAELARIEALAQGVFARGLIAGALATLAQRTGDHAHATSHRVDSGCMQEATIVGPTSWTPVTGVDDAGPLDPPETPLAAAYPIGDAFGTLAHPTVVRGYGCSLPLSAESSRPGAREVVVDVKVDRAQTIGVALRARGAAVLRAAGTLVLRRPFSLGDGPAARFARIKVTAGTLRLVARVGTAKDDDAVELDVWGEDGRPLSGSAPAIGSTADARATGVAVLEPCACHGGEELTLASAADLAAGDPREAEDRLWGVATRPDALPELALLYARAVDSARDLSAATKAERARSAYERALEVWPSSWEAVVAHAVLAGVRRGKGEAGMEILRDLDVTRGKMGDARPAMVDAFDAVVSGRERLFDRARAALDRARAGLAGTSLLADAERAGSPLTGKELEDRDCDPARLSRRDTLTCFDAIRSAGDRTWANAELGRVRKVLGAPSRFLGVELRDALAAGDDARATRTFGAMLPAEQTLSALAALDTSTDQQAHLLHAATVARDAPSAIAPLLRSAGDDPTREFEGVAERLAAQDHATPILPSAATAVLAHTERFAIDPSGLVRWTLFDVRRVSGTTDVEENAQAPAPEIWGRGTMRSLRRRILKHDGRILEPDQTPRASQDHADLSQLEQGDLVEAIYEGWALPGDTGDIGIDTTDLLPQRVAVHDATIELRMPQSLRGALWSHPALGKATERADGDARVLTWHVVDRPSRRVEDGVPKMDRSAGVSFSTTPWTTVARALRETIATLEDHDPEITAWAREAAGTDGAKPTRATVEALVGAAGKALREADPGTLSDYGGGIAPVQSQTARTFLSSHEGSRSWLVLRGLQELGIPAELRVAENDPFSADPGFPPHFGRFIHPLVVAHVGEGDVWIDADVAGPPLPAGRVSPELRGRLALGIDGAIAPLPAPAAGDERDEIDVRLALDEHGDARGTFAVVLRGRNAQELSEALVRIVGAERQRALRDVVLAWLPWANVDDVQLASSEGSWQVSLRADVSVSGYAQREGSKTWLLPGLDTLHWSWPRARVSSLGSTFATRGGRESALALSTAVQYHLHRRIELPKGTTVARMPGPLEVKAKLVEASRQVSVNGDSLQDDFVLGVATGTIATADYDAFVSVAHAADDGFLASTRVTTQ
jgi:hypothetical protein